MNTLESEIIDKPADLARLEKDWKSVYRLDPYAHFYVSWKWIEGWAKSEQTHWVILAVKNISEDRYVGFLPLVKYELKVGAHIIMRRLSGGGMAHSNYSGFVCLPESSGEVIEEMVNCLQREFSWDSMKLNWVRDPRIEVFARKFNRRMFYVHSGEDQHSLRIKLPDDYDSILKENLGKSTRKRTREKIRQFQKQERIVFSVSNEKTIENDIRLFCDLWNQRWHNDELMEWHTHIMKHFFEKGELRLTLLKDQEKVVAGLSCIPDAVRDEYFAYVTAYDPEYSKISPGIILFMESIKYAVNNGFAAYDLLVGMDSYKLSFRPEQVLTKYLEIVNRRISTSIFQGLAHLKKKMLR